MSSLEPIATDKAQPIPAQPVDYVSPKTWLAIVGSMLGAFLAILNIQVVNSSLADIQGAIGAGVDTGGWVTTSYLITEIIVIPLSGWLAQAFSLRRYLIVNSILFLVFSVACAQAQNLGQMIIYRGLQGFAGGVLIPLSFTLVMTTLPKSKQPIGLALFAFSATFAPAIGPTIGGWLNDTLGWEYIFYINLVPGAIMLAMLWFSLEKTPMKLSLLKSGDWLGIATMAIGLGALQTLLEEGNRHDWFGSPMIVWLSVVAGVFLLAFLWIELTAKNALVNLRLLRDHNFGLGTVAVVLLGFLLYGSVFVLPLYLSQVQGYNAMQIGEVLAWTGLPQLLLIPFVPRLMRRFDAKILLMMGFVLFAVSNFMNVFISGDVAAPQLLLPNIIRAVGQALILTPLTSVATANIAFEDAASASALFNMLRNLGGAVGIAALQTFLTKREQFHSNILTRSVSTFDPDTRARLSGLTRYFQTHGMSDPAAALHQAIIVVGRAVRGQASIISYGDTFLVFVGISLLAALVSVFLHRAAAGAGAAGAH